MRNKGDIRIPGCGRVFVACHQEPDGLSLRRRLGDHGPWPDETLPRNARGRRTPAGVDYLLKARVADIAEFAEALDRVAAGGTALDPEVVSQLLSASHQVAGIAALSPREREVLTLMAEGRSNTGIAAILVISDGAVEKHIANIFAKLGLAPSETDNRRVLAVLRYLQA